MSVVVAVKEVGPCRKQLTIEVPEAEVAAETQRVTREIGRAVQLPGFRKGKVPVGVIRKRFAGDIRQSVLERLLPKFWQEARTEANLDPLLPPEVNEAPELEEGKPLTFIATVDVRPEIELSGLDEFDLPAVDDEPTDDEKQEALDDLRRQVGEWNEVDRGAVRGDRVFAEITEIPDAATADEAGAEGEEAAEPRRDTVTIEVGDERVWEELSLALTGLSAGQSSRFTRTMEVPGGEATESVERHYEVTAQKVEEKEMPEADDVLAEKVGFDSIDEVRQTIEERLRQRKGMAAREQREAALLTQLRERNPVELPQRVVEHEAEHMMRDYAMNLHQSGVDVENAGIDWGKLQEDVRPRAEERVHTRLLLDAVAADRDLQVGDWELDAALDAIARSQNQSAVQLKRQLTEEDRLDDVRQQLRRRRAVAHLLGEEPEAKEPSRIIMP
jgi:trigger factor